MRDIFALFLHAIAIIIRLARPGGFRSVVAESVLMRHQVLILNRGRKRAPQSAVFGSHRRRSVHVADAPGTCSAICRPAEAIYSAAFSQDAYEAKVPVAVFIHTSATAGSERTDERTD